METTCRSLLYELQMIWDEVGESDSERDKMLFELEQECLEVYKRKVDRANRSRAQLRQAIADSEVELATICSAMGELPVHLRPTQSIGMLSSTFLRSTRKEDIVVPMAEVYHSYMEVLRGYEIFNADGEMWRKQRKTASLSSHQRT